MNKLNTYVVLFLSLLTFVSCDEKEEHMLINEDEVKSEVTLSTNSLVLTKDDVISNALTIGMSKVNLDVDVVPEYKFILSVGEASKKFSVSGDALSKVFSSVELNKLLLDLGAEPEKEGTVTFKGIVKLGAMEVATAEKSIKVTTYAMKLDLTTTWGVVGSATPNGWNGPDLPMYKNTENPEEMVAYVTLKDGEIKFRENNDWGNNYGGADGVLSAGGANIPITAGTYKITVNLTALTYKVESFTWGVVGSATPNEWNGPDIAMQYDPTSDMWKAVAKLAKGEIKFRKNNDWAVNFGAGDAEGTIKEGGANIPVEAGNYLIEVNFNDKTYKVTKIDFIWGVVGSATPNEWNGPDITMNMDFAQEGVWYVNNATLKNGEIKFRANEDWANNYGSNEADGNLQAGGANIKVEAGVYDIVLNLSNSDAPTYKLTKK